MVLAIKNRYSRHGVVLRARAGFGAGYGGGFWDTVAALPSRIGHAIRGKREGAPPDVREYLAQHSADAIRHISVCREPIQSGVRTALDVLTLGGFSAAARRLHYDSVFHLWVVLRTDGGTVRFEKNEVVRLKQSPPPAGECFSVPVDRPLTVGQLFAGGSAQNSAFWQYSTTNNCQRFTMDLLRGSGLDTPALTQFVLQDAASLIGGLSKKIADAVTDIAARADIVRSGLGGRLFRRHVRRVLRAHGLGGTAWSSILAASRA